MNFEDFKPLGPLGHVTKTENGIIAPLGRETLKVDFVSSNTLRIKISQNGIFDEFPTFAIDQVLRRGDEQIKLKGEVSFKVKTSEGVTTVRSKWITFKLTHEPFAIDVYREDGTPIIETVRDSEVAWSYATDGEGFVIRRKIGKSDSIYGLGEKTGKFNRRGRDFTLWNTDVLNPTASGEFTEQYEKGDPRADNTSTEFDPYYVSIPFFYHQTNDNKHLSASFIDNGYRGYYDFSGEDEFKIHFGGGQYTEYVFGGPDVRNIIHQYTLLTGRMPLPPIWSIGFHQCRWFPYNQDDVERIVAKFRELDVPLDAFWLDIDYMDGYRVFTWNKEKYPDAPAMLKRLEDQGVKVITIIDPGVKEDPGYEVYDDGLEKQIFAITETGDTYIGQVWPGDTAFPDFANKQAREWWGALNAEHVKSGLAGIWNDMNEPATGDKDPMPMRFDRGRFEHERFHNQYAMLMAMGTTEGLLKAMPNKRTFVLSRAGSAGIQRYAANWMGDNMSRWDHLKLSISMGAGLGMSGQPFVGADIGGFAEDTNAELYTRWIQYGALTPFARVHSVINTIDQYPWSFGDEVLGYAREALKLRYRLLPYIYSAFTVASKSGNPVQRPMLFDFQYDKGLPECDDQYMFGQHLLVAPIVEPGQTSRPVYLPEGEWYDFHTDEYYESEGRYFVVDAPMDRIPVFVRAGAVIPMLEDAPLNTKDYAPKKIQLHFYVPKRDGLYESLLREDDGLTFDAEAGAFYSTWFEFGREGNNAFLRAKVTGSGYETFARETFELVIHSTHGVVSREDRFMPEGFGMAMTFGENDELIQNIFADIKLFEPKKKRFRR